MHASGAGIGESKVYTAVGYLAVCGVTVMTVHGKCIVKGY